MGASASIQEKVLQASADGDLLKLKKYAPNDEDGRLIINLARDKEERSCLIIAAIRGQVRVAKFLLERGVDVHYQAPSCGSALHVAAARKHDEMVDVLLRYGADPFIANLKGSTALELAVLAGSESVVSKFHSRSLFSGEVEMQWKKFMSYEWKPRFIVVMERRPCPLLYSGSNRDTIAPVRRQMWIHSKQSSLVPKTRCWIEGSSSYLAGAAKSVSVVRLHIAHAMPTGNCFTRFAEGYCFFTRPSTGKKISDNAVARWAHFNECIGLEGGADTVFSALGLSPLPLAPSIALIPSLTPFLLEGGGKSAASGSAMPLGALPPPPLPSLANNNMRSSSSMVRGSRSVAATPAATPNPLRMSINALPSSEELAAAALGGLNFDPNQMPALSAASVSLPSTAYNSSQSTPMRGSYAGVVDGIAAKPGETDAQFASRLAEAVSVAALADGIGRMDHRSAGSQSHAKAASLPATPLRNSLAGAIPTVGVNSISTGGTVGASAQGSSSGGGSRDMARSSSSGITNQGVSRQLPPKPPSNKLPSFVSSKSASKMSYAMIDESCTAPSAPPLEDLADDASEIEANEKDVCVICLSAPSQLGFLHGSDVHRCICSTCSKVEWVGKPCPVCRATIEKVLGVF